MKKFIYYYKELKKLNPALAKSASGCITLFFEATETEKILATSIVNRFAKAYGKHYWTNGTTPLQKRKQSAPSRTAKESCQNKEEVLYSRYKRGIITFKEYLRRV